MESSLRASHRDCLQWHVQHASLNNAMLLLGIPEPTGHRWATDGEDMLIINTIHKCGLLTEMILIVFFLNGISISLTEQWNNY